jgi:Zn-dependent M16 (insulinase) family peptidase
MSNVPKTNLKKDQKLDSGFIIIDIVELKELKACGIWAKHEKCGVEVFHILNDDSENLFSFSFATSPDDNTGAPHILEHSVLCGSERYPLKDAFIVLAQGSLQTFLNAMTFPDKTVYPASSTNEHDYFNLMSVYGNSVFKPLLPEWTFMQEGHRLEYDKDGKLSITGVVYNEMKGAYSSLDNYAGQWSIKAVMTGTPYEFDCGGDPQHIPELTWDGLKEFYRTRYSPANCRIFLAGNIPTEKQLSFLNDEFFSKLPDGGKSCEPVKKAERWKEPKKFHIPCPAGSEKKSTVFLSWLLCDVTDVHENIALAALTEILLGHDGSPLTRTLIESGLGEDLTPVSGLEGEIRETLFVAGLKGVDGAQKGKEVEDLIMGCLQKLYNEGIPEEEIEAALLAMEFSQREIRRSGGPFSLVWMRRSLRTWLHGCKPWDSLLILPSIAKIKENLSADKRYFESLIKKYLLDNPHHALVILEPKEDFLPQQEQRFSSFLADKEKAMDKKERKIILEKSKALQKIQNKPDSSKALASIPHLSRNDLYADNDIIDRRHEDLKGIPALYHELYTNGITYTDLAFPVDVLNEEEYFWLPFFSRAIVSVGLPGMDYGEVSSLLARTAGGFISILHTGSAVFQTQDKFLKTASGNFDLAGRDWIIFRLKCLDEKIASSLELVLRLICSADFTDHRRINDLVLEMKTEIDSNLAPVGHIYASGRAGQRNSASKKTEEMWNGLSQIEFVHRLVKYETAEIAAMLEHLRKKITDSGLIANITGTALVTAGAEIAQKFSRFGPPVIRREKTLSLSSSADVEVFASRSLQVGFAAFTMNAAKFDTKEQLAETVLTHQLSTGVLWENIRMKGGAYGAFSNSDSIEDCVSFATYRDPSPLRSLEAISSILKNKSIAKCTEDYLVKSIIGCYARETRPRTSAENGFVDFYRFLYKVEDSYRKRKLERLISISPADIESAFDSLRSRTVSGKVIIAGEKAAEQAAKALGTEVQILPV